MFHYLLVYPMVKPIYLICFDFFDRTSEKDGEVFEVIEVLSLHIFCNSLKHFVSHISSTKKAFYTNQDDIYL